MKEQPLDIERLLHNLKPENHVAEKKSAAEKLGQVDISSLQIVQALVNAKNSDPSYQVRVLAAESLQAPAHQEILRQHSDLAALATSKVESSVESPTLERRLDQAQKNEPGGFVTVVARVTKLVLLIDLGLLILVAAICWFIGWRSLLAYATALKYAAFAVFLIGCVMFASTGLGMHSPQRVSQRSKILMGLNQSHRFEFLFVAFLVATVLFGIGTIIAKILAPV